MKWQSVVVLAALLTLSSVAGAQVFVPQENPEAPRVKYADSLTSLNDMCAVANRKLSLSVSPVYVNGRPVAFCCTACPAKFSAEPEVYLPAFAKNLPDPVHPERDAQLNAATKTYVNHDVFFFSDSKSMKAFQAKPLRYAKKLTDPVSRNRFAPTAKSPHTVYDGRPYYFESAETLKAFQASPTTYAIRKGA